MATCGLTGLGRTSTLDTTLNTVLVASRGADGLGRRSSGGHVGIDVGEDVDATVLVDQVDVVGGSHTLLAHDLKLGNDILERTTSGEGAVGSDDAGHVAVGSIDDGLVVELVDLSVVGDGSSLLELDVVLDAGTGVQEVGDHGGIGHPVGDGCGKVGRSGSLTTGDTSTLASRLVGDGLRSIGVVLLSILLLLLVRNLCERSSVNRGGKERGNENVLHFGCVGIGSTE
ncbi:hypothetical protein A7L51_18870 [Acinetobacter baumannii]|nr:hypothetical protein A7L51_18870 [Acinetobacter baumannii]